jgi:hypothetical protein
MQYVSVDSGIPVQAEYIRHGLDYMRMFENVDRYLTQVPSPITALRLSLP